MARYKLKEDFAGKKQGEIFDVPITSPGKWQWFYKGVEIILSHDSPLLERVVEWKVGDVLIARGSNWPVIITGTRKDGKIELLFDDKSGKGVWREADEFTPAPPLPVEPIEYEGVKYRVKMENGVPVYALPKKGEWYFYGKLPLRATYSDDDYVNANTKCYILEPIEELFTLKDAEGYADNFRLIEAAIRELQKKVKEGK